MDGAVSVTRTVSPIDYARSGEQIGSACDDIVLLTDPPTHVAATGDILHLAETNRFSPQFFHD